MKTLEETLLEFVAVMKLEAEDKENVAKRHAAIHGKKEFNIKMIGYSNGLSICASFL